jgi:hypothetical protein
LSEEKNIPEEKTKDDSTKSFDENIDQKEGNLQSVTEPEFPPDNPVEQTTISKSLPKKSFKQTPENMEVHNHGHVHEKKKWKEYLFQFFMLFLAVFCGFLAEYQLEQTIERHREKEYIETLVVDVKDDIKTLNEQIAPQKLQVAQTDSLVDLLSSSDLTKTNTNQVYYFGRLASRYIAFNFNNNDRTIEQMKNSGGFRLIRNQRASDIITQYYQKVGLIKQRQAQQQNESVEYQRFAVKVFDPVIFKNMVNDSSFIIRINNNPPLLNSNKTLLKELAGVVQYLNGSRKSLIHTRVELKKTAEELLKVLQQEYYVK